jgi:hypothetical protein
MLPIDEPSRTIERGALGHETDDIRLSTPACSFNNQLLPSPKVGSTAVLALGRRTGAAAMRLDLLLIAIVREAGHLVAAVATHRGARTSLAHLNDHFFYGVAGALHAMNVRRRVGADMLGMAPRAYLRKLRRVEESLTDRGRCLWEAVYDYVASDAPVSHAAVQERFHRDDQDTLRGVLSDLRDTGAILSEGRGPQTTYRIATGPELKAQWQGLGEGTEDLIWTFIHHEGAVTRADLQRHGIKSEELERALTVLLASGRVSAEVVDGETVFRSVTYRIPIGTGLEGPILDHFHAVVKALGTILTYPEEPAAASSYKFDVWPGHPMAEDAKTLFREWRTRASELRERIDAYNASVAPRVPEPMLMYLGLCKDVPLKSRESSPPPSA